MATLYATIGGHGVLQKRDPWDQVKDFLGKVAAHVPSEVLSIYAVGKAFGGADLVGIWTFICWLLCLAFRWFGTKGEGKVLNVILTTIAFPIWAMTQGGNILGWALPDNVVGLAILIFSAIAGFLHNNK
jgi:hypothetical protein